MIISYAEQPAEAGDRQRGDQQCMSPITEPVTISPADYSAMQLNEAALEQ